MRPALALTAALVLVAACGSGDDGCLPTATIVVTDDEGGRAELTVEVLRTPAERSRGLSHREELAEDSGMLFVFAEDTTAGFWMKDTAIPLAIAFIAEDGIILDIQDMEPLSTDVHEPPGPYRYALEVNAGWLRGRGFGPGDQVGIPDSVVALTEGE